MHSETPFDCNHSKSIIEASGPEATLMYQNLDLQLAIP